MELLAQGAEAKIFRDKNKVIKERLSKDYRLPQLDDSLRKFRTRREAKVLHKLGDMKFPSPRLHDFCDNRMMITMDFVEGQTVRDVLDNESTKDDYQILAQEIGKKLALMHTKDIIHGDFTTSNILKETRSGELKVIDFGLSFFSGKVEDKAVDLFLLDRALASKHFQFYPGIFEHTLKGYKDTFPEAEAILARFEQVKNRGRNKKK
ncbi:Kae1-associated serine/threonine protein kinase [archaeon]|jgi:TP53 regulating kinase and related kinases|nr:Kae1-associated serine/threonine protein kinase [archaeon]MBT3451595.1 Kae1-associated serine/threonine protein kinase [archaeon]MBT6869615.1 Kae1-associated serine/threonine protein kinase [archaeon]MBT7192384.1 Kae1-associated serine/threonine protein kinase [archaeon]MBT7380185.1 Kae1-associated serine/threonine protein kinase [archaeon]